MKPESAHTTETKTLATTEEAIRINAVLLDGYVKIQEILAFSPVCKEDIIAIIQSTLAKISTVPHEKITP